MTTLNQRLAELEKAGFKPVRDIFAIGEEYGLSTDDYEIITYDKGLELVTDFTPIERAGNQRLNKRTHINYIYCKDGEMPTMLKFMQPKIRQEEMAELIKPLETKERIRKVQVGKRLIVKMHPLAKRKLISYHMDFLLHRIWEPTFFLNLVGLGTSYDFLLPHPDYYTAKQ